MKPSLPGYAQTDHLIVAGLRFTASRNGVDLAQLDGMAPPLRTLTWHDLGRIRDWIARQLD